MSKKISNYFELKYVCRSAGLWFVGSFMGEFLSKRGMWSDSEMKPEFIGYMWREFMNGIDSDITGTRTRVNCVIRIIESKMVKDALGLVLEANDEKLDCPESKINAQETLDNIKTGKYEWYKE